MLPPGHAPRLRLLVLLTATGLFTAHAHAQQEGGGLFGNRTGAPQQESKLYQHIMNPDMTLHAQGFEKSFGTKASGNDRAANVRAFAFGSRAANTGAFNAKTFNDGRGTFRTDGFAVKRATAADQHASLADRSFATSAVPVREDRLANKTLGGDRAYINSTKPFLVPGKRQDVIDDLRKQKNLSVDEIRDILNKSK